MTTMWLPRGEGVRGCYTYGLSRDLEVVKNWNDEGCRLS